MPRLLVIDDDPAFRDGLAETLRDLGHDVTEAVNGEDGLARFGATRPDLVFLDLRMPGMDGLAVLARIRGDAAAPAVPVVVLTAFAQDETPRPWRRMMKHVHRKRLGTVAATLKTQVADDAAQSGGAGRVGALLTRAGVEFTPASGRDERQPIARPTCRQIRQSPVVFPDV